MKLPVLIIALLTSSLVCAVDQQLYKQHGEYKVFYSAFNSSFIDPDIAVANDIVRGKDKGLVNIAVAKVPGVALPATVSGRVFNILQQSQTLEFVTVR